MPFCPSCHAEYEAGTEICADCEVRLVERLRDEGSDEDTVDVYRCCDAPLAERAAALLAEGGISALLRDHASVSFPTTVGSTAEKVVAVPAAEAVQARQILQTAVDDGVLTDDGELVVG